VTYQATSNPSTLTAANGRILFGIITTVNTGGTDSGTSGGSGGCFSGNTEVRTPDGNRRFDSLRAGDQVITREGVLPIRKVLIHDFESTTMLHMGDGELVTRDHLILTERGWLPAAVRWRDVAAFKGKVYNLEIETEREEERNYLLANGVFAHNYKQGNKN